MFNLGDKPSGMASQRVKHLETDSIGIVIGFGLSLPKSFCAPKPIPAPDRAIQPVVRNFRRVRFRFSTFNAAI